MARSISWLIYSLESAQLSTPKHLHCCSSYWDDQLSHDLLSKRECHRLVSLSTAPLIWYSTACQSNKLKTVMYVLLRR
jgi:hypothetical protein